MEKKNGKRIEKPTHEKQKKRNASELKRNETRRKKKTKKNTHTHARTRREPNRARSSTVDFLLSYSYTKSTSPITGFYLFVTPPPPHPCPLQQETGKTIETYNLVSFPLSSYVRKSRTSSRHILRHTKKAKEQAINTSHDTFRRASNISQHLPLPRSDTKPHPRLFPPPPLPRPCNR